MLEVTDLGVAYGGVPAVQGVTLEVRSGEIVSLVGSNGAGKTSTLMAVFGVVRPVRGSITFEGRSIVGLAPEQVARGGIALVPEGRHIFASLTVAENLRLGAVARDRAAAGEELDRVLSLFPILKTRYASSAAVLSGGEQQQLAIGRALMAGPRLLLLDEPSLGLAPKVVEQVFDTLLTLRSEGMTILLVEQNALQAVELADRAYVLSTGRIAMAGDRVDLLADPRFEAAYLGF
jgi:branched-chain amino acid transport system ATP-binding protein